MRNSNRMHVLIIGVLACFALAFAQTTMPSTKPTTKPATSPTTRPQVRVKEPDPLRVAITELSREAQAALAARKPFPRDQSDYFKPGHNVEPQALLGVLGGRLSQNPRVDAYVKYQLLSAFESFSGDLALPALKAYVLGAPPLIALPGVTQQEQQKWNQKAIQAKQDDVVQINEEWKATLAPYVEANAIIISYRDLMKSRIHPPSDLQHKFYQACLEDLAQRGAAGFEIDKPFNALSKQILVWAATAKRAPITDMLSALKEYSQRRPPKMLEELRWRNNKATWTTHDAGLNATKVRTLQEELEKAQKAALE